MGHIIYKERNPKIRKSESFLAVSVLAFRFRRRHCLSETASRLAPYHRRKHYLYLPQSLYKHLKNVRTKCSQYFAHEMCGNMRHPGTCLPQQLLSILNILTIFSTFATKEKDIYTKKLHIILKQKISKYIKLKCSIHSSNCFLSFSELKNCIICLINEPYSITDAYKISFEQYYDLLHLNMHTLCLGA